MHRVQRAIRAAFLAATLFALAVRVSVADSRLSLQCKNIARDVIINSCKGPRIKRATPSLDLDMLDEKMTKLEPTESSRDTAPVNQKKRQFFPETFSSGSGLFSGIGLPATNIAANTYHKTELNVPGVGYVEDQDVGMLEESFVPELPIPYRPFGSFPIVRSIKPDQLLGFELSSEELEELYCEIGDRMPRNSKDLKKKIFQTVAMKCCPNPKLCDDNPSLIPCMGY